MLEPTSSTPNRMRSQATLRFRSRRAVTSHPPVRTVNRTDGQHTSILMILTSANDRHVRTATNAVA